MVPAVPPEFAPIEVDRVVWSPTGPAAGPSRSSSRAAGAARRCPRRRSSSWRRPACAAASARAASSFPPPTVGSAPPSRCPARLRGELQSGAALRLGAAEISLPAARVGATVGADVVEPSVLVDRRALREEPLVLSQRIDQEREARARAEAERDALAQEIAAARATAPAAGVELEELRRLRSRVDDLNDALVGLAGELRVRLRDEAAARWVAEAELRTERAHVGALRAEVATLQGRRPGALRAAARCRPRSPRHRKPTRRSPTSGARPSGCASAPSTSLPMSSATPCPSPLRGAVRRRGAGARRDRVARRRS